MRKYAYIDQRGYAHDTLVDMNNANMRMRVANLRGHLSGLISQYSRNYGKQLDDPKNTSYTVERCFAMMLSNHADLLASYIKERDEIQQEIDSLTFKQELSHVFRADWWLREELKFEK